MRRRKKVVIVEGIIGAGKSSITRELGHALGDKTMVLMEPDEAGNANPYLADFYEDQARWAFVMQIHLLQARYRMHLNAQWYAMSGEGHSVLDRCYFGDTCFARLQLAHGAMTQREFDTYRDLYHAMTASVLLPNVCVRLLVSPEIAKERIDTRMSQREGRRCESGIDLRYLMDLDREISHMVGVLRQEGVTVIDMPWDVERESPESRRMAVESLACRIAEECAPDPFLDLHRRTL